MYRWINSCGETTKTRSVKEFAQMTNLPESHCRDLACGYYKRYRGWCSGHPSAKAARERFLTVLIHPKTGQREILGQTVTGFCQRHGLSTQKAYNLINGKRICYKGWMLERTHKLALAASPESIF